MALRLFKISDVTIASPQASVDFQNIPSGYTDLIMCVSAAGVGVGGQIYVQFNTLTAGSFINLFGSGSSVGSNQNTGFVNLNYIADIDTYPNTFGNASIYIPNYTSNNHKSLLVDGVSEGNVSSGVFSNILVGLWNSTSAINRLTFLIGGGGNFATNSTFTLYGVL